MGGDSTKKLLYPELSYNIVGILFKVHDKLPSGCQEKHVQRAVAASLLKEGISFKQQLTMPIKFEDKIVGRYFFDFTVEDKIVIELKIGEKLSKNDFDQIKQYLQNSNLKLGLLARFGRKGVKIYRVLKPPTKNL